MTKLICIYFIKKHKVYQLVTLNLLILHVKKLNHNEILLERLTVEQAKIAQRHPIKVMLSNVRSLYNVGSIFRTCDSALVSELILSGFTPTPPRQEIEKTALGAVETVPWKYFENDLLAINYLKSVNQKIIALEITDKKRLYTSLELTDFPCCLVLGNELTGLSSETIHLCDDAIEIPMFGVKHSLNVSVAAGIAIFEAVRKFHILSQSLGKNNENKIISASV